MGEGDGEGLSEGEADVDVSDEDICVEDMVAESVDDEDDEVEEGGGANVLVSLLLDEDVPFVGDDEDEVVLVSLPLDEDVVFEDDEVPLVDGVLLFVGLGEDDDVFDGAGDEVGPLLDELDVGGGVYSGGGGPGCSLEVLADDEDVVATGSGGRTATATDAAKPPPAGLNLAT